MTNRINEAEWLDEQKRLVEFDIPAAGGQPDPGAGGAPETQPGTPGDPMASNDMQQPQQPPKPEDDISGDPEYPEMPGNDEKEDDFEVWKQNYVKESIKGDPDKLLAKIRKVRDNELDEIQEKFVEDNLNINLLRQNSNIFEVSTEIRKRVKKDFDRTHPATSVLSHIAEVLEESPLLNEVYIKCSGLGSGKHDQHRKFIGSLLGAVQVGSGGNQEDLVFEETDYSIRLSTRFNSKWGDVSIGKWSLNEDDPDRFLKDAERERLEGGSPEEKDVLRRRVIIESIAETYMQRAFIINVIGRDGTIYHLGWDLGNCIKAAFLDGKLVVRTNDADTRDAFIDEEGSVITMPHMGIYYIKEDGKMDEKGKSGIEEIEFMSQRNGFLYLTAPLDLVKEAATSLQGMLFKQTLWQGNPSDLLRVKRNVPTSPEMLMRQS